MFRSQNGHIKTYVTFSLAMPVRGPLASVADHTCLNEGNQNHVTHNTIFEMFEKNQVSPNSTIFGANFKPSESR